MGDSWPEWHVQIQGIDGSWRRLTGASGRRGYVTGYFHAMRDLYARHDIRLVGPDGTVHETWMGTQCRGMQLNTSGGEGG